MNNRAFRLKCVALGLPAFCGFLLFYILPFGKSVYYSFINNTFQRQFVFFDNYISVLNNQYYQLALKNTFVFSVTAVACALLLALVLSIGLIGLSRRLAFLRNILILPMILPTACTIFIWHLVFRSDSYFYFLKYASFGKDFFETLPLYMLYLWKNTGINVILLTAAIARIPADVYEAAALDGASGFKRHRAVTFPLIVPSAIFVMVLSFVNALKSFKESYLFFRTDYPPDAAYTVQYYMNNHFRKLNYQNLTAGVNIFTVLIVAILLFVYVMENKYNESIY